MESLKNIIVESIKIRESLSSNAKKIYDVLSDLSEIKNSANANCRQREYTSGSPVRPKLVKLCQKFGEQVGLNEAWEAIKNGKCVYEEFYHDSGRLWMIQIVFPCYEGDDTLASFAFWWPKSGYVSCFNEHTPSNPQTATACGIVGTSDPDSDVWKWYILPDDIKDAFQQFCNLGELGK